MKRSDIVLLLLGPSIADTGAVVGTTRLQKLLFLLTKEGGIVPGNETFEFVPYKFGPASKKLYDDLEFLTSLGLIERSGHKSFAIESGPEDIDLLSAGDLLADGEKWDEPNNSEKAIESAVLEDISGDAVVYRITEKGLKYLEENDLLRTQEAQTAAKIRRKYSRYSLHELLGYVYSKYRDYTTESEIKDRFRG